MHIYLLITFFFSIFKYFTNAFVVVIDIDTPMSEAFHQSAAHVRQNNDVTDRHINTNDEFHASTSGLEESINFQHIPITT
jgi:hypothetical protein